MARARSQSSTNGEVVPSKSASGAARLDYMFVATTRHGKTRNRQEQRSHVMQSYFRSKLAKSDAAGYPASMPPATLTSGKMSFRLGPNGLEQRHPYWYGKKPPSDDLRSAAQTQKQMAILSLEDLSQEQKWRLFQLSTSPALLYGIGGMDPFHTLPINLSHSDEMLLSITRSVDKFPWCPIHSQTVWQPFALSDELLLHVTLYIWSWSFRKRVAASANAFTADLIEHKASSLKLINSRLSDPLQATMDQTIAAVAALTTMEVMLGTKEEAEKHMKGLQILVALRGGFSTFVSAMQLLIQRLICWTDLIYSELFDEPLSFPEADIHHASWKALDKTGECCSPFDLSGSVLRPAGVPLHITVELLYATHQLCHAEQIKPLRGLSELDRMRRGDMFHSVERRLRLIVQETAFPSSDPSENSVWRAIALTNLMFVHHHLRGNSIFHRQFGVLLPSLQQTLMQMDGSLDELAFAPALRLWILGVGAVISSSSARSTQDWFIKKLAEAWERYSEPAGWQAFRNVLAGFLWTGYADDERYWAIWRAMEPRLQAG